MKASTRVRLVATGGAVALAITACSGASSGGSGKKAQSPTKTQAQKFLIDDKATGPAPAIPGAKTGGKVTVLERDDFSHLDPARIYVNNNQAISEMVERQLNTYVEKNGTITLVGDLATNTGETKDGGKTWTYHLRDGIAFQDGNPITSADIQYGVERGFDPAYTEGPTYIYSWLAGKKYASDFHKLYTPGKGDVPGITTPDPKTIVFTFDQPRPDMPFAAALTTTSPVQKSKDTGAKYDLKPQATGPYMISEHTVDKSLTLVKNPKWDPKSDPARYQLIDEYDVQFGTEPLAINNRLIAANGADATAMTISAVISPEILQKVDTTPALKSHTVEGSTAFVEQFNINNTRIPDVAVRKALVTAFPTYQTRLILGGPSAGDYASTVSSPTLPGYESFDLYGQLKHPEGQPEVAKKMLTAANKLGQTIVYAYPQTPRQEQVAVAVVTGLEKAGFKVVKKPIDSKTYYDEIGKVKNTFDLYAGGWGADWPSGATVFPPTIDGRQIFDGSANYEHFKDPAVNAEIDRISLETDLVRAGKDWAALDKKVMEQAPYIPWLYDKSYQLYGSGLGNVTLSNVLGNVSLNGVYIK